MMGRGHSLTLLVVLLTADLGLIALGVMMPQLRQDFIFAPEEARVQIAIKAIEAGEQRLHRQTGQYLAFGPEGFAAKSRQLKLDWDVLPSNHFQFDAQLLDDHRLRLRAMPRGDAVAALDIAPRMFVAELPARPDGAKAGWYP
jgi:hypothetical protein